MSLGEYMDRLLSMKEFARINALSQTTVEVYLTIAANQGIGNVGIRGKIHFSPRAVGKSLFDLRKIGVIERKRMGARTNYFLTDKKLEGYDSFLDGLSFNGDIEGRAELEDVFSD